ncbi:hypothetical protein KR074_009539, partial [Drosophila pseudoananassae]
EMALRAYLAESINVAAIMGIGDGIAQLLVEKKPLSEWDVGRTARFSALGFVVVGPVLRTWFMFMESRVSKKHSPMRRGITKMLMDQCLFAPPFTLAMSYMVPKINGEEEQQIRDRIRDTYFTILSRNYMLWPMAQFVNFSFVPLQYQVMYVQCIALIWNSYLSMMLNK